MKDYKKILEGVVDIINTAEKGDIGFANICTYIGENCPELKESEDERIRKALKEYFINSFQNNGVAAICGVHIKDILAWLEKQGNNMGISEATKQKLEDNLNRALEKETPESYKKFLDEQKPVDTEKGAKGNNREIPISAWTEEDEEEFKIAIDTLVEAGQRDSAHWLKSLKDRVQPKQEWSEEDERMLNEVILGLKVLKYKYSGEEEKAVYQREIDWLEHLKERYTWKPSDEQIEALESATENCAYSEYQDCLRELIKQLKKLREEKL